VPWWDSGKYSMPQDRLALMGLPHWGLRGDKLHHGALCCICGRVATNAHHLIPKGMGGGSTSVLTPSGQRLYSPLIAVCGIGNTSGCHKRFHGANPPKVRWEWKDSYAQRLFENGDIWFYFKSNAPELNAFGEWVQD